MLSDNLIENHFDQTLKNRPSEDFTQRKREPRPTLVKNDDEWQMVQNNNA